MSLLQMRLTSNEHVCTNALLPAYLYLFKEAYFIVIGNYVKPII